MDVVFDDESAPDTTPPVIVAIVPGNGAVGVSIAASVTATFNEAMDPETITSANIELRDPSNALVPSLVSYVPASRMAVLDPAGALEHSTIYTATVSAAVTISPETRWERRSPGRSRRQRRRPRRPTKGPADPSWSIASAANPFGRYYAEILRCEGLNAFTVTDLSLVTPAVLTAHDVAILAEVPALSSGQATMLSNWVTNEGGNLIAMRPDPELAALCGLSTPSGTLANAYMLIDTGTTPGAGLVAETIQFHGAADLSALDGAIGARHALFDRDPSRPRAPR